MTRRRIASLLVTSLFTIAWAVSPSERLLTAQDPVSPNPAAGTAPAAANPTTDSTIADLASQVDPHLQVLTQGPVHEAFGQPVLFNPTPNPVIPKKPPAPVQEIPPSTKPAGPNVQWIPGYWAWESTEQKFVWTSGIWRRDPAGARLGAGVLDAERHRIPVGFRVLASQQNRQCGGRLRHPRRSERSGKSIGRRSDRSHKSYGRD